MPTPGPHEIFVSTTKKPCHRPVRHHTRRAGGKACVVCSGGQSSWKPSRILDDDLLVVGILDTRPRSGLVCALNLLSVIACDGALFARRDRSGLVALSWLLLLPFFVLLLGRTEARTAEWPQAGECRALLVLARGMN